MRCTCGSASPSMLISWVLFVIWYQGRKHCLGLRIGIWVHVTQQVNKKHVCLPRKYRNVYTPRAQYFHCRALPSRDCKQLSSLDMHSCSIPDYQLSNCWGCFPCSVVSCIVLIACRLECTHTLGYLWCEYILKQRNMVTHLKTDCMNCGIQTITSDVCTCCIVLTRAAITNYCMVEVYNNVPRPVVQGQEC